MRQITLTEEQTEAIEAWCDDNDVTLRLGYSGRGMNGESCIGIVTDEDPVQASVNLSTYLAKAFPDDEAFLAEMRRMGRDNMGQSTIIYWPRVKAP